MKLLREYIRKLLSESRLVDFAIDLGQSEKYIPASGVGDTASGREIKRIFNKHADHAFLKTLDTVHWGYDISALSQLIGRGRDELSATMTLPGEPFSEYAHGPFGLVIQGRITLASNDMDEIYSGGYYDYIGSDDEKVAAKQKQRQRSSGISKLPQTRKDYSAFAKRKEMLKSKPELADNYVKSRVKFVLDRSTWNPGGTTNEALVDNWKPVGLVSRKDDMSKYIESMFGKDASEASGEGRAAMELAQKINKPIYNRQKQIIWLPAAS